MLMKSPWFWFRLSSSLTHLAYLTILSSYKTINLAQLCFKLNSKVNSLKSLELPPTSGPLMDQQTKVSSLEAPLAYQKVNYHLFSLSFHVRKQEICCLRIFIL